MAKGRKPDFPEEAERIFAGMDAQCFLGQMNELFERFQKSQEEEINDEVELLQHGKRFCEVIGKRLEETKKQNNILKELCQAKDLAIEVLITQNRELEEKIRQGRKIVINKMNIGRIGEVKCE